MKITAQLSGVNRPLSVELRLIHFCSCDFDSQVEHDTSSSRGVLTKRSDFRSAQGLVRHSPFGGVVSRKQRTTEQKLQNGKRGVFEIGERANHGRPEPLPPEGGVPAGERNAAF